MNNYLNFQIHFLLTIFDNNIDSLNCINLLDEKPCLYKYCNNKKMMMIIDWLKYNSCNFKKYIDNNFKDINNKILYNHGSCDCYEKSNNNINSYSLQIYNNLIDYDNYSFVSSNKDLYLVNEEILFKERKAYIILNGYIDVYTIKDSLRDLTDLQYIYYLANLRCNNEFFLLSKILNNKYNCNFHLDRMYRAIELEKIINGSGNNSNICIHKICLDKSKFNFDKILLYIVIAMFNNKLITNTNITYQYKIKFLSLINKIDFRYLYTGCKNYEVSSIHINFIGNFLKNNKNNYIKNNTLKIDDKDLNSNNTNMDDINRNIKYYIDYIKSYDEINSYDDFKRSTNLDKNLSYTERTEKNNNYNNQDLDGKELSEINRDSVLYYYYLNNRRTEDNNNINTLNNFSFEESSIKSSFSIDNSSSISISKRFKTNNNSEVIVKDRLFLNYVKNEFKDIKYRKYYSFNKKSTNKINHVLNYENNLSKFNNNVLKAKIIKKKNIRCLYKKRSNMFINSNDNFSLNKTLETKISPDSRTKTIIINDNRSNILESSNNEIKYKFYIIEYIYLKSLKQGDIFSESDIVNEKKRVNKLLYTNKNTKLINYYNKNFNQSNFNILNKNIEKLILLEINKELYELYNNYKQILVNNLFESFIFKDIYSKTYFSIYLYNFYSIEYDIDISKLNSIVLNNVSIIKKGYIKVKFKGSLYKFIKLNNKLNFKYNLKLSKDIHNFLNESEKFKFFINNDKYLNNINKLHYKNKIDIIDLMVGDVLGLEDIVQFVDIFNMSNKLNKLLFEHNCSIHSYIDKINSNNLETNFNKVNINNVYKYLLYSIFEYEISSDLELYTLNKNQMFLLSKYNKRIILNFDKYVLNKKQIIGDRINNLIISNYNFFNRNYSNYPNKGLLILPNTYKHINFNFNNKKTKKNISYVKDNSSTRTSNLKLIYKEKFPIKSSYLLKEYNESIMSHKSININNIKLDNEKIKIYDKINIINKYRYNNKNNIKDNYKNSKSLNNKNIISKNSNSLILENLNKINPKQNFVDLNINKIKDISNKKIAKSNSKINKFNSISNSNNPSIYSNKYNNITLSRIFKNNMTKKNKTFVMLNGTIINY